MIIIPQKLNTSLILSIGSIVDLCNLCSVTFIEMKVEWVKHWIAMGKNLGQKSIGNTGK